MLGLYARTTTPGLISFLTLELGSGIYISTSFNILFLAPHPFFITLLLFISIIVSWHYYFVVMEFTTLCHGVYYLTAISLKISRILLLKKKTTYSLSPYPNVPVELTQPMPFLLSLSSVLSGHSWLRETA